MDELLLLLAEKGAIQNRVRITTKSIGASLSMSQQNASVRLRRLEREGFVSNSDAGVQLTEKGRKALASIYSRMKSIFQQKRFVFTGKIVKGSDEGKYYVSLPQYKNKIKKAIGFIPFSGTLNIELDESQIESRVTLREHKPLVIEGFKSRGRSFGPAEIYPCTIGGYSGALIFPFRSHHGLRILEIISPYDLTKKLPISTGSKINVEVVFQ
jgi:riboflavin kinase, archaea type